MISIQADDAARGAGVGGAGGTGLHGCNEIISGSLKKNLMGRVWRFPR